MSASDWKKIFNQLGRKKAIIEKVTKHNKPKVRKNGIASLKCKRCGRFGAHISSYDLHLCRQCFREIATDIGFKKYS